MFSEKTSGYFFKNVSKNIIRFLREYHSFIKKKNLSIDYSALQILRQLTQLHAV